MSEQTQQLPNEPAPKQPVQSKCIVEPPLTPRTIAEARAGLEQEAYAELLDAIKATATRDIVLRAVAGPGERFSIPVGCQWPSVLGTKGIPNGAITDYLYSLTSKKHYRWEYIVRDGKLVSLTVHKRVAPSPQETQAAKTATVRDGELMIAPITAFIFAILMSLIGFLLGCIIHK